MVRLVASDMDGTLLDEESCVPEETFGLIRELRDRGVLFVAASGRRADTLAEYFEPVEGLVDFVASNGAQVVVEGHLVDRASFSCASVRRLARAVGLFDCLHLALFDRTRTFVLDEESCYGREADKDLPNLERVDDVPSVEVDVVKASIYCDESPMDMAYALSRELGDEFTFAPSGRSWIDVMQRGVNKATGLASVLERRGIEASEVMAFGDSMNDYEILRAVGHPVAMGNARPAIKRICARTVGTNADSAVQAELRALVEAIDAGRA